MMPQTAAGTPRPLLVDLYELTMAQSYFDQGMNAPATFSLFSRHLPPDWGYFLTAGLDDVLDYLESFSFERTDIEYLASTGLFSAEFLKRLSGLRFTGTVRALPEGTACFPQEPLLEVTAPVIEAQLVETVIVNQVHLQTVIASKAVRSVEVAQGRKLIDFSLRRTHGYDAGLKVARAAYLAGFDSTSNVLAGQRYGLPISGTMAHSYIQAFPDELSAFRGYARTYPDKCLLLIDTYDTIEGARRAVVVGRELAAAGHRLRGVRLDSGDLIGLSFPVRRILDEAGFSDAIILASGGVDETLIDQAVEQRAPIDAFGVGTRMGVSAEAPYLDMAYKLVAYAGQPRLKLSQGKATWPGAKQIWRQGTPRGPEDLVGLAEEVGLGVGSPLLVPVMERGERFEREALETARDRARRERLGLPASVRQIRSPDTIPVRFSEPLTQLRDHLGVQAAGLVHTASPELERAGSHGS